jgi:hypothetical protein
VPLSTLTSAPYLLITGDGVFAKVIATNVKGDSQDSQVGNVATIISAPDAPINLAENTSQRTPTNLGLVWSEGASNGGAPVTEYRIDYADRFGGGSFSVLATTADAFYEVTGLTSGSTYDFKIVARNEYGYSLFSSTLSLLAAYIPEVPTSVTTEIDGSQVKVLWTLPSDNGSPITAYKVYIQEVGTTTYTQESTDCDGTSATVISNRYCHIEISTLIASYNLDGGDSVYAKVVAVNFYGESA